MELTNRTCMSSRPFSFRLLFPTLFVLYASTVPAQNARVDDLLNQLSTVKSYSDVALSPNGHSLAWTESVPDSKTNELHLLERLSANAGSSASKQISLPETTSARFHDLVWSPDGTKLAFLASSGSSQDQIYTLTLSGGTVRALTTLKGYAAHLAWVGEGKQISFLYAENGGGEGPLAAEPEAVGEIGSESHNQRLTLLSEDDGALQQVSPVDLNIYEYDWSPDRKSVVAIAAPGPADNNWWIAKLYKLDLGGNGSMSLLYQPGKEQQIAVPRWSPDGKQIAFIGGIMSDQGFVGGDVFVVPANGGTPQDLIPNARYSASSVRWKDAHTLLLSAAVGGGGQVLSLGISGKNERVLWKDQHTVHEAGNYPNLSIAADGATAAMVKASWSEAPEVWAGSWGNLHPVTNGNSSQKANWGKAESVEWTSDSFHVQGWLLYPQNYQPTERYPMIVSVHGGPAGSHTAGWPSPHFDMSVMAGLGYFVFFPNPRGSYGQGEAFTKANVKDFGGGDLRDILAGVDQVLKTVPVDSNRIGITGWSYGGYMTMWTVTQTQRFRAAVAGAGIANWLSYYGENSIDEWMIPYFGASVYDDRAVYAKSSPITFIKQVKTPTLVIVGERDGECPSPQSFEFWHALKSLDIPSKLVVYPGEGHAFRDAEHNRDRMRRTVAWFDQYLRVGAPTSPATAASGQ